MSDFFNGDVFKPVFSPVIRITKNKEKPTFVSEINGDSKENIFDRAQQVKSFMQDGDLPLMKAAKLLGCDGKGIANKLRLLEFSREERELLTENGYSEEEALLFLQLDRTERLQAIEFCCKEKFKQAEIEEYILKAMEQSHEKRRNLFEVKDVGFVENSLKKTVTLAEKMGFELYFERQDGEEYHVFTVKVKKKK